MSNESWRFDDCDNNAPVAVKPKGCQRKSDGHTTIDLQGVAQIPLDCLLTLKQSERQFTAEQTCRSDQAIADACAEMLRRKLAKLRG